VGLPDGRGSVVLLNLVEILFMVAYPQMPELVAWLSLLLSHSIPKEVGNELSQVWKELLLFWKCVLANCPSGQGSVYVLFTTVSLAPSMVMSVY
jgi:hypothetical protein